MVLKAKGCRDDNIPSYCLVRFDFLWDGIDISISTQH